MLGAGVLLAERAAQGLLILPCGYREAAIASEAGDDTDEARLLQKVVHDLAGVGTNAVPLGIVAALDPSESDDPGTLVLPDDARCE